VPVPSDRQGRTLAASETNPNVNLPAMFKVLFFEGIGRLRVFIG